MRIFPNRGMATMRRVLVVAGLVTVAALSTWIFSSTSPQGTSAAVTNYTRNGNPVLLTDSGARPSWSRDGNWIYYDHTEADSCTDIYKVHPDGTGSTCITCGNPSLTKNSGLAEESPDGQWLVFLSERSDKSCTGTGTGPGGGAFHNLWVRDQATGTVTQLTNVSSSSGGSLHPHWSDSGTKIFWVDRTSTSGGSFGNWRMAVADFVATPTPHLANITYYEPAVRDYWYESHGWALSDTRLYFTCTDVSNQNDFFQDACYMDFSDTSHVHRLTATSGKNGESSAWDEHLAMTPRDDAYAWMSSNPYTCPSSLLFFNANFKTEFWMMNTDGTNQTRMSWFNDSGHTNPTDWQNAGPAVVSKVSWDPVNQNRAVAYVQYNCETGGWPCSSTHPDRLFILNFTYTP